jgi:hypothetical protein
MGRGRKGIRKLTVLVRVGGAAGEHGMMLGFVDSFLDELFRDALIVGREFRGNFVATRAGHDIAQRGRAGGGFFFALLFGGEFAGEFGMRFFEVRFVKIFGAAAINERNLAGALFDHIGSDGADPFEVIYDPAFNCLRCLHGAR